MNELLLPVSVTLGLVCFGLAARWYLLPALDRHSLAAGLVPLLLLHGLRYVGLAFRTDGAYRR
jgi:hypothetical protein